MAACRVFEDVVLCLSGNQIAVTNVGLDETHTYQCTKDDTIQRPEPDGEDRILAFAMSPSRKYFVTCDDWKQLTLWDCSCLKSWKKISVRPMVRRGTSLVFNQDESEVLVGDKSGDVFTFSTSNAEKEGELLMGHLSMLLDITLCGPEQLIATADRDEKIRVSCYPNAYNIQTFCLGHTKFVSRVLYLEKEDCLLSGGGDGCLRIWNYRTGECLAHVDCSKQLSQLTSSNQLPAENSGLESVKTKGDTPTCPEMASKREQEELEKKEELHAQQVTDKKAIEIDEPCPIVNCIKCDKERNLVAVSFVDIPIILIYKLAYRQTLEATKTLPELSLLQKISTVAPPWEIELNPNQASLYVLQPVCTETLALFKWNATDKVGIFHKVEVTADSDEGKAISIVNRSWDFLKDSEGLEHPLKILQKPKCDMLKDLYYERKKQRIQQQESDLKSGKRKGKQQRDKAKRKKEEVSSVST